MIRLTDCTAEELQLDYRQELENYLFFKALRPVPIFQGLSGRVVNQTNHLHVEPRLIMYGALPPLPLMPTRRAHRQIYLYVYLVFLTECPTVVWSVIPDARGKQSVMRLDRWHCTIHDECS